MIADICSAISLPEHLFFLSYFRFEESTSLSMNNASDKKKCEKFRAAKQKQEEENVDVDVDVDVSGQLVDHGIDGQFSSSLELSNIFKSKRCFTRGEKEEVRNKVAMMKMNDTRSDKIRRRKRRIATTGVGSYSRSADLRRVTHTSLGIYYYLFLTLAIILLGAQANNHFNEQRDVDPLQLPEYSPTRKPQRTANPSKPQEQLAQPTLDIERASQQQQPKQQQQQQDELNLNRRQVAAAASSVASNKPEEKFTSNNELDVFLDDMNHNELRAIASGQPISDLFQPKAIKQAGSEQAEGQGAAQDTPLVGSHSEQQIYTECALILQRTYVKNIDSPKHQLVPFGKTEQSCISYKHIDKAVAKAKKLLKFNEFAKQHNKKASGRSRPPLDVIHKSLEPPEDLIAAIGELNMATTQIIADQFELSNDELLNGLPLIDMSKTKFWPMCPLLVRQNLQCQLTRYRTFTGHCNNLKHPTWGAAMSPFARYLPPVHPDGIWAPRKSIVSEVTFELGPGHRELHASVSPTDRVPIYSHSAQVVSMRRVGESDSENVEREESAQASVEFVRHSKLDLAANENNHRVAAGPTQVLGEVTNGALATASSMIRKLRTSSSIASELPSARLVSSIVHRDVDLANHDLSILFMSWGQLLDHDMTRAAQPPSSIKCCPQEDENESASKNKLCLPIDVPENDPFYSKFGVRCLEFRRSLAGLRPNCVLGPRVHQNAITSPIDANFVYGSSQAQAEALRLFKGGKLRSRDWFVNERLKPILPAQEIEPDRDCLGRPENLFCFLAGDVRVNEQIHLTVLHTLYMREHNRMAEQLEELNPHWDDERIYQETRHIIAAGVQHVMLNEYLPLLIGQKMTQLYNLTAHESARVPLDKRSKTSGVHWPGYDPSVTTSVANSFAAAAFRQGHTFIQGTVERYNKFHEHLTSDRLRDLLKRPFLIYQPKAIDHLTGGLINQPSQGYDPFISEDISGHLFQEPRAQFGHDLPAINLQRGREQGLPGYNLFREWCGLPRAESFSQLEPYLANHTAYQYSRIYKHVDDIDLWSGGVSERRLPGAAIGPTFACIIARQFSNTRRGDRFWYENPGLPSSFTPTQLSQLRRTTLAKIICENSDDLPTIQRWPLRMPHPVLNPRVPCSQLPEVDLTFWQEGPLH